MANTFQVQRVTEGPTGDKSDVVLTLELAGVTTIIRMTAEAWSKAIALQKPEPVAAFRQSA